MSFQLYIPTGTERTIPDWFTAALYQIDPALIVYFNPLREKWIIDRCTRGVTAEDRLGNNKHIHDNSCPKTNVRVVQDEHGNYMPLCQEVIDWFRRNDIGSRFSSPEEYVKHLAAIGQANDDKMRADRKSNTRHVALADKAQLNRMHTLVQRHDLRLNK